jgi:hypothetical protein
MTLGLLQYPDLGLGAIHVYYLYRKGGVHTAGHRENVRRPVQGLAQHLDGSTVVQGNKSLFRINPILTVIYKVKLSITSYKYIVRRNSRGGCVRVGERGSTGG